jgi:hypothetical protein
LIAAAFNQDSLLIESIEFLKPLCSVGNKRLKKDALIGPPDTYTITFEAKIPWQPNRLTAPIAE